MQAPRGTFDVLPEAESRYAAIERICGGILGRAGYGRIETPAFESTDLFTRGVGEATDIVSKEMYTFDDGGGRSMTLRPEGTAPICRAYSEHGMHRLQQPVRLWYMGSFFRHENPQAGRFRQFNQIGAEALGSDQPALDAELIVLLAEVLEAVGVRGCELRVGSLGSPERRAEYRVELAGYLRENAGRLTEDVRNRIDSNPLRAFDSSDPETRKVMEAAPRLADFLDAADAAHFSEVTALLDAVGIRYTVDTALVRGLDYYTRTVFEFTSPALGAQSGVGGGGRYDRLVEMLGGPQTAGIGWAAGVERIILASEGIDVEAQNQAVLTVPLTAERLADAFRIASELRRAGFGASTEVTGRSLKAALKHADKTGKRWVLIVGDEEASLKDLSDGSQTELEGPDAASVISMIGRE